MNSGAPPNPATLAASDAVFDWCLRNALRMERLGEVEQAGVWGYVAAATAVQFGHTYLCSAPLESLLLRIGRVLPDDARPARSGGGSQPRRGLHVFTMTSVIGGHTAIARRWIDRNPLHEQHSVVLTSQPAAAVDGVLAEAVRRSGGQIRSLEGEGTLFARSAALRRLAREEADYVVVYAHGWDVMPTIAFAVPGGPPVLLMNHADHSFWVGCAVSDVIVDIRDSGLALSASLRGARATAVLPVPIEDHGVAPRSRAVAATRLPDPSVFDCDLVLLTIGREAKYQPLAHLDFHKTARRIVEAIGDCALVAVGPNPRDAAWRQLGERTGGRIVAVGEDRDLAPWHAAADLYLEGFPIGSYTALLEVALAERAFVRKPHLAPPSVLPLDRGALAAFAPPTDQDAYAAAAIALAGDSDRRSTQARAARVDALAWHCGSSWDARLEALLHAVPAGHDIGFGFEPQPMPNALIEYWAALSASFLRPGPLEFARASAKVQGLRPRTDVALLEAMQRPAT